MISALICTEDPAFTLHKGVCPYALGSISADLCSGRMPSKGGSSLTQQLAKNAFFKSERSVVRKVRELVTALVLEVVLGLSKREIIELYLNMAEFGAGVYGVVDAARHYFGKESGDISDLEAIVLTYILPRPLFFEEALLGKTERLRANLSAHIERFAQSLAVKERPDGSVERFYANGVINFAEPFGAL